MAHLANNETASRPGDERQSPSWYHPRAPARYADLSGSGLKTRSGTRPVTWTRRHRLLRRPAPPRAGSSACGSEAMFGSTLPPASTFSGSLARHSRAGDAPRAYSRLIIASTLYPTGRRRSCQGSGCVRTIRRTFRGPRAVPAESIPALCAHRTLNHVASSVENPALRFV